MLSLPQDIYLGVYQVCLLQFSTISSRRKVRVAGLHFLKFLPHFLKGKKILVVAFYVLLSIPCNQSRVHFSSLETLGAEFWLLW